MEMSGVGVWMRWSSLLVLGLLVGSSQQQSPSPGIVDVRLVGGSSSDEGRLQVRLPGQQSWGLVCRDNFDERDAAVVCRQINPGYDWGEPLSDTSSFGPRTGPVHVSSVMCRGNETSLGQCQYFSGSSISWICRSDAYSNLRNLGLRCYRNTVRLRPQFGGFVGASYGVVEVLRPSNLYRWVTLCDSDWDDNDARVVCRSAGFVDGQAMHSGGLSPGVSSTNGGKGTSISCLGNESSFDSCTYTHSTACPSNTGLASAVCYSQPQTSVDRSFGIRLTDGTSSRGRVEVKHLGVWGSVCAANDTAADVACRQIRGGGGGVALGAPRSFQFQGSSWATELNCGGSESSLEQCVVAPWGAATSCLPAYSMCYQSAAPVVQLVGGSDSSNGRVEIVMDGSRYTVCDDSWNNNGANVVCRSMGYAGGVAIKGSHYGKGSDQVALNNVLCGGNEDSLLQCRSDGWLKSNDRCNTHTKDASVFCHGHVLLQRGDHSNGIVQVMIDGAYRTICGTGFGDTEAGIVCRDHGFQNGRSLPAGSYSPYRTKYTFNMECQGNEISVYNCSLGSHACASNGYTNYAAVHCYNGSLPTDRTVSLSGGIGDYANSSGHVKIYQGGVSGRICSTYWDDQDAQVVCRQLGYSYGLAYGLASPSVGPFQLTEVNCQGSESSIFSCPMGNAACTSTFQASAICFNNDSPHLQLVGGSSEKDGRVEIVHGGTSGTVCIIQNVLQDRAARIVCQNLGYDYGVAKRVPGGTGRVMLDWTQCSGFESNLLGCINQGFMAPPSDNCKNHDNDLGVTCFQEVKLSNAVYDATNNSVAGIVELYKNNAWNFLCSDSFGEQEAGVVCRQMGYSRHRVLPVRAFGTLLGYHTYTIGGLVCSGSERSLGSCPLWGGVCSWSHRFAYASVLCSKGPVVEGIQALQPSSMPGDVVVKVDGLQSSVCSVQWDDNDATVYCRDLGYNMGRAFGTLLDSDNSLQVVSQLGCNGTENSITDCNIVRSASTGCGWSSQNARVFCYDRPEQFQVRLVGGPVRYEGNVEIGLNGQWMSVCDYDYGWTEADANVVCRSLGFAGGERVISRIYGPAAAPTFFFQPSCQGLETSITACPMSNFNDTTLAGGSSDCPSSPAAVRCTGEVKLTTNTTFGAVQMLVNANSSSFGMVCADGFGPQEASVTCRDLGYPYGLQMSGDAFAFSHSSRIQRTNLQCTGNELALRDCSYSDSVACPSMKQASVVCSTVSPSTGYSTSLEITQGYPYGRAKVHHMGYWGYICPNNFDNNDAAVFCRESGYTGGIAFTYHNYQNEIKDIRWLKDIGCTGLESYLIRCPNVVWGNITGCSFYADAGAFCYKNSAPQFRLVNGTSSMGRLELWTEDARGTVCGQSWTDREARAACRSMSFHDGRFLGSGLYGQGSGIVWLPYSWCTGRETSLFDCHIKLRGQKQTHCNSHLYDAAVQCFNTTRLTESNVASYGRVEVLSNQTWVPVCDQSFNTNAARVVCRTLGYSEARPQCCSALGPLINTPCKVRFTSRGYYPCVGKVYKQIGLKVNHCNGSETSLLDCDVSTTATCSSGKYASVLCSNQPIQENRLETRLVQRDSPHAYAGSVQVNRYGFWGPVCNSSWDDRDANATCHGLGFNYGITFYARDMTGKPMVVGNVQCGGLESTLADCQFGDMDDDLNCSYGPSRVDAGALCFDIPGVGVRLVDGEHNYGRVEVQFQGQWGRVVDSGWTITDASVACRQLGFETGSIAPAYTWKNNNPKNESTKVWMMNVECSGHERTLFECFSEWDVNSVIVDGPDVHVVCSNGVRLVGGNRMSVGLLEVNINNNWGSVCDSQWSTNNTRLACQQLGYDNGLHLCCGAFGRTNFPLMTSVSCRDSDTDIRNCSHGIPESRVCSFHSVALACFNSVTPTNYSYSLAGGDQQNSGKIEVSYMNITGHICSDGWDDTDAKVFCSELGYPYGQAYDHAFSFRHGSTIGPYWATNVNCQGTETRLRDCGFTVGTVTQCQSKNAAGVLCTNTQGIFYRLQGDESQYKGRVEVAVDGQWGSVCSWSFETSEANIFCRSIGFSGGKTYHTSGDSNPNPPSTVYSGQLQCTGDEDSLNDCPHRGWGINPNCTQADVAQVFCFNDVRIGGAFDPSIKQGHVQFYRNDTWYNMCDTGFDDVAARRVCQDLEYEDGKALCCSAYGSTSGRVNSFETHLNYSMRCDGHEQSAAECIKVENNCSTGSYASVVCFTDQDYVDESTYSFDFEDSSKTSGVVAVTHMNITGRVCNNDWDDNEARVLCRSKGHLNGIAFHFFRYFYASYSPFWVSSFNCTGNETSLNDCPFKDRLHLGNCSKASMAGALCLNDSSIQYRISSDVPKANEGRVEMSVGGVWGTVCGHYWINVNSKVMCRTIGYSDGYRIGNRFGNMGSGPMWISHVKCKGTESTLHQCPHEGFSDAPVDDSYYRADCTTHHSDVYVACVYTLKLSLGYNSSMGAVMVYRQNKWNLICDGGFDQSGAQVVCRQLGYDFGTFLKGSKFGTVDANITISSLQCRGTEADVSTCQLESMSGCNSNNYASVYCSNQNIIAENPNVRVVRDDPSDPRHGYLEFQVDSVWGAVCASTMDTITASVACKQLGFTGGIGYKPNVQNYKQPILTSDFKCLGIENTLTECPRVTPPASASCDYNAARAGVLCYNDTEGVSYRLAGDASDITRGRFEMKYKGQYGFICSSNLNSGSARVACRSLGHGDGLPISGERYTTSISQPAWLLWVHCIGNERSIPECSSTGFNVSSRDQWHKEFTCSDVYGPLSVQCYRDELAITDVRLVDGDTNSSGRVEVFVKGANEWGTVCDDNWNDVDATVVCNQLGFATGRAVVRAGFGEGEGRIWMETVGCRGNETRLQDCVHNGFNLHSCLHSDDAGAICSGPKGQWPHVTNSNQETTTKTAAIVTPVVLILVALVVGVGIAVYRRRGTDAFSVQKLQEEHSESSDSRSVSFGQGGVVRFINRIRGKDKGQEGSGPGLSTARNDCADMSNPCYDIDIAHSVPASEHADFNSHF